MTLGLKSEKSTSRGKRVKRPAYISLPNEGSEIRQEPSPPNRQSEARGAPTSAANYLQAATGIPPLGLLESNQQTTDIGLWGKLATPDFIDMLIDSQSLQVTHES